MSTILALLKVSGWLLGSLVILAAVGIAVLSSWYQKYWPRDYGGD